MVARSQEAAGFAPVERPRVAIASDGTLAAIHEPSRVSIVEVPGCAAFAEIGIDREATASDVAWVGAPPRLLVLARYAAHSTVHLVDPYGPRSVAEIRLEAPMTLCATVGAHALAVGALGTAVLATSDGHLTPYQFPARAVPVAAGAAGAQFVVALAGSIEEWDPQTRMPKRRLKLPRPAVIRALGGSDRVVWMTTQGDPARIDVIPLVNRGQPKHHELPEPIAQVAAHPRSDLLVCLGAERGRVYVVDLDGRHGVRTLEPPELDRADAVGLVIGRLTGALAARAHHPVAIVTLDGRDEPALADPPAPDPLVGGGGGGGDDAAKLARASSTLYDEPPTPPPAAPRAVPVAVTPTPPVGARPALDAAVASTPAPDAAVGATRAPDAAVGATRAPDTAVGATRAPDAAVGAARAPDATVASMHAPDAAVGAARAPDAAVGATRAPDAAGASTPAPDAAVAAAARTASPSPAASPPTPFSAWRGRARDAPGALELAASAPPRFDSRPTWRDELAVWARAVATGALERDAPVASAIEAMAARFDVPASYPALALLYGAHLAGEPGVAPLDLARVLHRRWDDALGRGALAARGLAVYRDSRVRLAPAIERALDELPPRTGALVGEPASIALLGPCVVVAAAAEPIAPIALELLAVAGSAILVGHPHADARELVVEARARGALAMLRATAHAIAQLSPDEPVIIVVDDEPAAEQLGLPRLR